MKVSASTAVPSNGIHWFRAFGRSVSSFMAEDPRIVALTAAMPSGTGLAPVAREYPDRVVDVGICEQHAVGLAAGMAEAGLKPIVAIYSTFLQRGYDQVFQEVAIQGLPVVFALDRAGIVGGDGVTHQGLYDIAFLRAIPGLTLMAPADPPELDAMLRHALAQPGPAAVRYPRGSAPDVSLPKNDARIRAGRGVRLREGGDLMLVAYGSMVRTALDAAERLAEMGVSAAVFNARFARPLDTAAIDRFVAEYPLLLTLEEHGVSGGFGSAVLEHLATQPPTQCIVRIVGVPDRFVPHGSASDWRARFHLDAEGVKTRVLHELKSIREAQDV